MYTLTTTHAPPALLGNAQFSGDKGISQRLCRVYHFGVRKGRLSFPIRLKWWFGLFSTDIGKPLAARQGLFP